MTERNEIHSVTDIEYFGLIPAHYKARHPKFATSLVWRNISSASMGPYDGSKIPPLTRH